MMVITVQDVDKLLCPGTVGYPVKSIAMRQVFKKGPEEHSGKKQQGDLTAAESAIDKSIYRQANDKWKVHTPYYKGICLGKHFQVWVLEKLGLAFIMNFLKFHL